MKKTVIIILALLLVAALVAVAVFVIVPKHKYQKATELLESGEFDAAASAFAELGDYSDSAVMVQEAKYRKGAACLEKGDFDMAIELFTNLADYADSPELLKESTYNKGVACLDKGDFDMAIELFTNLADYADSPELLKESIYKKALSLIELAEYKNAYLLLTELGDYDKASERRDELVRLWAERAVDCGRNQSFSGEIKKALADRYEDYESIYEGLAAELVSTFEGSEAEYDIIHSTVTSCIDGLGEFSYHYSQKNMESVDSARTLMNALPDSYMGEPEIKPFVAMDNEYMYIEILGGDVNAPEGIRIDTRVENRSSKDVWLVLQHPAVNGLIIEERNYCDLLPGQKADLTIILPKDELGGSEAGPITGICFVYDGIGDDVDGDLYSDTVASAEVEIYPYGVYWYRPYEHEPDADDTVVVDSEYGDMIITDCSFNDRGDYELGFWVNNRLDVQGFGDLVGISVNGISVEAEPFLIFYKPFSSYYDEIIIPATELQAKGIDEVEEVSISFAITDGVLYNEVPRRGAEGTVTIRPAAAA